jgi:hypothetical protein
MRHPYNATPAQVEEIKREHLPVAAYNSLQAGVFSLSGWDLVGALPLASRQVTYLLADNDYRWLDRGIGQFENADGPQRIPGVDMMLARLAFYIIRIFPIDNCVLSLRRADSHPG